ncbi:MAG TPA: site-2 protease family protein [Solirubrobacteraceae bacterium]|jgi:Zn-dependent protease|nr:site-2 protease family protein [Solirubrobacteraceae bacterium]
MPGGRTFQLARIFGIRIGVSTSWFFVLFFFIWILSDEFRTELGGSDTTAYVVAVACALSFFASLIVHELGHALVARHQGIGISGIDLWFFGGIARMTRDTGSPGEEFRVAAAGPLLTLMLAGLGVLAGTLLSSFGHFWELLQFSAHTTVTPALALARWLVVINAAVFVFNLVPAFPLDGGRIARAIAWRATGDRNRATRASGRAGQVFAYVFGAGSLWLLLAGDVRDGLWGLLLAMFLNQAARGAVLQSAFSERLEGITVADIMDREPVTIPDQTSVLEAHEQFFLRYRWPWFAVVDPARRFVGVLRRERVDSELSGGRPTLTVSTILEEEVAAWQIAQDQPLEALLGSEGMRRLGAMVAVDEQGVLRGVVTLTEVRRALTPVTGV